MYLVSDEESGELLVSAREVEGFFVAPQVGLPEVVFLDVDELNKVKRRSEDAVLNIVNGRREKIGEYLIGRIVLGDARINPLDGDVSSIPCRFVGNRCDYPLAAEIWRRWVSGIALEEGEWAQWPPIAHAAWLHVVQNSWFATKRRAARYGADDVAHLDGACILTRSGFFCALGEAVNGPGGYFGSNLDALADCLSSDFGEGPPARISWRNFETSQESLDRSFLLSVLTVMHDFHIDVTTS